MPMKSDSRAPTISRESMSRPSSSLPKGRPSVPMGLRRLSMDDWYGSDGASHGPNTAIAISSSTTMAAPTATGSRRKRSQTEAQ